jgi:hypothetical protein
MQASYDRTKFITRIQGGHPNGFQSEYPLQLEDLNGLAVDSVAHKLYWGSTAGIQRARYDWSEMETLLTSPGDELTGPALDLASGQMYFLLRKKSDSANDLHVRKARIGQGGTASALSEAQDIAVTPNCLMGRAIAVDPAGGRVYWAAQGWSPGEPFSTDFACIYRAKLDGSDVEGLVYVRGTIGGIALDPRPSPPHAPGNGRPVLSSPTVWPLIGGAGTLALLGLAITWRRRPGQRRLPRRAAPRPDERTVETVRAARLRRTAQWSCACAAVLAVASWGMSTCSRVTYHGWVSNAWCGAGIIWYERKLHPLPGNVRDRMIPKWNEPAFGWEAEKPNLGGWRKAVGQRSLAGLSPLLGLALPRTARANLGDVFTASRMYVMPLWVPSLLFATLTVVLFLRDRRRAGPGHCRTCGYNLTGNVSGICPECSATVPEQVKNLLQQRGG